MQAIETNSKVVELIKFSVYGTHEGLDQNPMPKLKMTGKQHWMPKAQKYVKWKSFLVARYLDTKYPNKKIPRADFGDAHDLISGKPIVMDKSQRAHMHLHIVWADETHGDPENIFGSVADALFKNDKHLAGSFDFEHSKNKRSRIDITIQIHGLGTA